MKPQKVLLLTFWYPSENSPVKGIFILEHARAIMQAGCEVVVLAIRIEYGKGLIKMHNTTFTDDFGLPTHLLSIQSRFYKFLYINTPLLIRLVLRTYYKHVHPVFEPDIIHSNVINPCGIAGHFLAGSLRKPHVITEHWAELDKFFGLNVFSRLGKRAYNNAGHISVVSAWLKQKLQKQIQNSNNISIIPNVIAPVFRFNPNQNESAIHFVAVAWWEYPKIIQIPAEALQALAAAIDKPIVLNIVGDGSRLIPVLNNRHNYRFRIVHHGFISRMEISELMSESHFFLHCSEVETFSIAIAEALCAGLPVLASNVAAIPELINESNGILCENNVESWKAGLLNLLDIKFDRAEISRQAMGRFHAEAVGRQFLEIYSRL